MFKTDLAYSGSDVEFNYRRINREIPKSPDYAMTKSVNDPITKSLNGPMTQ